MKTIAIDRSIRDDPGLVDSVVAATNLLEEELGESAGLVELDWRWFTRDKRGRDLIVLRLSDWTGFVEGRFAPDELNHPEHLRGRFIRLWGDLLQIRSHKQLESLGTVGLANRTLDGQDAWDEILDTIAAFREREGLDPTLLKLPVRYAIAPMKLGPSIWGTSSRRSADPVSAHSRARPCSACGSSWCREPMPSLNSSDEVAATSAL